jgi:hypothetical protein
MVPLETPSCPHRFNANWVFSGVAFWYRPVLAPARQLRDRQVPQTPPAVAAMRSSGCVRQPERRHQTVSPVKCGLESSSRSALRVAGWICEGRIENSVYGAFPSIRAK